MTIEHSTMTYLQNDLVSYGGSARSGGGVASTAFSDLLQGASSADATGGIPAGVLPVEMYAIPDWYADYGFQVPNQLGVSGNWFADRYPEAAAASQAERDEYSGLVRKHYDELLDANGIHDTIAHYNAMIRDPETSDQLRQEMADRVQGDSRLMELMTMMGKTVA